MCSGSECLRLYSLIDGYLPPFTESEQVALTKDEEKRHLIALYEVSRQLQQLAPADTPESPKEDCRLVPEILYRLIPLLSVENQFVRHSAGNFLVAVSDFLERNREYFIRLLFVCVEMVITNMCSSPERLTNYIRSLDCDFLSFIVLFKPTLKNANWFTVAGILRVLRKIWKYLKQEFDDELVQAYLVSLNLFLSNVPWDALDETYGDRTGDESYDVENGVKEDPKMLFLGTFIQLLCSLVEQISSAETFSPDEHVNPSAIKDLVQKLLYWCLGSGRQHVKTRISQYFRHKLLLLMIRLSFQYGPDCSLLVSWLELLHDYFEDLLCKSIIQVDEKDVFLEDSPFLSSVSIGEAHSNNVHSLHLQRLAVFVFLRCSITLMNHREDTDVHCVCATTNSCLVSEAVSALDCSSRSKGLSELHTWLCKHLQVDRFVDHEVYMENCMKLALSFLQLYVHEDDVLFRLLLQLLSLPSYEVKQLQKEKQIFENSKEDMLFHFSNVFNPLLLFHLFLAELHYDHQVLLDYLISKDTGITCAEYLLRSLRMVCNSWQLFVQYSTVGEIITQSSSKKRKFLSDRCHFQSKLPSSAVRNVHLTLAKRSNGDPGPAYKHNKTREQNLKEAIDCLLSLKNSVENLYQKNLFPYNPEVLLKRISSIYSQKKMLPYRRGKLAVYVEHGERHGLACDTER